MLSQVILDWAEDETVQALPDDAPVVLICHGIMGSAEDNYCMLLFSDCINASYPYYVRMCR